eukprot:11532735-Prorocentrum_lima.AAC.1
MPEAQYQDRNIQEPRLLPEIPSRDNDPAADFDETVDDIVTPEVPVLADDLTPSPTAPEAPEAEETEEEKAERLNYQARFDTREAQVPVGIGSTVQVTVFGHASGNEFPSYVSRSHVADEGG